MFDINILELNESYVRVACEPSVRYDLYDVFKFHVEGSQFSPKVRYGVWDGFIRLYNIQNQTLPKGLLPDLLTYCKEEGYSVNLDRNLIPSPYAKVDYDGWLNQKTITAKGERIQPHWYQYDSVLHALNVRRAILKLPTSAGKSLIIALLTRHMFDKGGKVLILVPTDVLRYQMADDLMDYSLFTEDQIQVLDPKNKKQVPRDIVITTWHSAAKRSKEWLEQFSMLLNDEVHLATGKSLQTINEMMVNAEYKLGLTGTLKDTKCHIMQLKGLFGQIYAPLTTRQMIDEGSASAVKVHGMVLQYPDDERKALNGKTYQEEIDVITNHPRRNNFIVKMACSFKTENTIILFHRKEHGKKLFELTQAALEGTGRKVYLIYGGTAKDDRQEAKKALESEVGSIVIASYGVFATGVSINNLHNAIFAHPTKSKIISLQSLGRLLRKHKSKAKARMIDLVDDFCWKKSYQNYAYKHGTERLRFYAQEEHELQLTKVNV